MYLRDNAPAGLSVQRHSETASSAPPSGLPHVSLCETAQFACKRAWRKAELPVRRRNPAHRLVLFADHAEAQEEAAECVLLVVAGIRLIDHALEVLCELTKGGNEAGIGIAVAVLLDREPREFYRFLALVDRKALCVKRVFQERFLVLDNLEKIVKTNSQNKILKFWKLFIKDDDDEGDDESTADEKKPLEEAELVVAECCHPLPGDSVVGFKDPLTHKIFVHKSTCDELNRLASQHGECIVKEAIQWSQFKTQSSLVTVEIVGIDRMGVLVDLANVVTNDFSINMRQVNIQSHDGIFEGTLSLYVRDAESLNALQERLRRIKGMDSVKRVNNQ